MLRECENCEVLYDDAEQITICPHNSLHGNYCRYHDLFNCYICKAEMDAEDKFVSWGEIEEQRLEEDIAKRIWLNKKPKSEN